MQTCITADIGGTNARFFLHRLYPCSTQTQLLYSKIFSSQSLASLDEGISLFLAEKPVRRAAPSKLVVSIAGTPEKGTVEAFANLNWPPANEQKIKEKFSFSTVKLLNDFEAVGFAARSMDFEGMVTLKGIQTVNAAVRGDELLRGPCTHPGDELLRGHCTHPGDELLRGPYNDSKPVCALKAEEPDVLFMGGGTGLGVVFVTKIGSKTLVVPSESGHHSLGGGDATDIELQKFVVDLSEHNQPSKEFLYADCERIFCGLGLPALYKFCESQKGNSNAKPFSGKEVVESFGKSNEGFMARQLFIRMLGRAIGNLSRVFLLKGGRLVLAGVLAKALKACAETTPQHLNTSTAQHLNTSTPQHNDFQSLWSELCPYVCPDKSSELSFSKIELLISFSDIAEHAVEGCVNYLLHTEHLSPSKSKPLQSN